jgi:hypothetical protein
MLCMVHPRLLVAFIVFLGAAAAVNAGEAYYMAMFGSQRVPNNPNYSHTWTTFVRVTWPGDGPCPRDAHMEAHTISFLPVTGKVRIGALFPEPGRNYELHETFNFAYCTEQRVSMWGPYCIDRELYCRAVNRKAELDSGHIRYKANDFGYRSNRVTNCIHAVSTIAQGPRLRVASPGWGESASYFVLKEFEPWIISKDPVPWVGSALDLDKYPIIYRDFNNPRSNAVFGPIFRLLGSERDLRPTYGPPVTIGPVQRRF